MATCELCQDHFPDEDTVEHIRVMHPDVFEDPERWPDGEFVVYEDPDDEEFK